MRSLEVNVDRIKYRMERLGEIGRDPNGGWTRFSFSEDDFLARELVLNYMREAGLATWSDAAGNIFGRREGSDAYCAAVASGSHIDTVKNGGLFDGNAGVICALEVAQVLADAGIVHKKPYEMIIFAEEEGGRFGSSLFGSRAMAGQIDTDYLKNKKDKDGITQWEAMKKFGLSPEQIDTAKVREERFKEFFELHVEQGNVLERNGEIIGVVEGIVGIIWLGIKLVGVTSHAGATPMGELRRDALVASSEIIMAVEKAATEVGFGSVATVGHIKVTPSVINVIAGEVELGVDIRAIDQGVMENLSARIKQDIVTIASKRGIHSEVSELVRVEPTMLSSTCIDLIVEKAVNRNIPFRVMHSGAGHDSQVMASVTDVGMIFVPSKGGISHSPLEDTSWKDLAVGAQILLDVVLECIRM